MERLPLKTKKELIFIDFDEIIYIEKFQNKAIINTKTRKIEISESLASLNNRLDNKIFVRSHKSYIVNINFIKKIVPWGGKTYRISFIGLNEHAWFSYERYREFKNKILS